MKIRSLLMILAVLGSGVCAQADVVYDATADFSTTTNPNGVWTYGTMSGTTPFAAFGTVEDLGPLFSVPFALWDRSAGYYNPAVAYNYSANSVDAFGSTWPAHSILLDTFYGDEGPVGWPSIRFTAPADGSYNFTTTWQNADTGVPTDHGTQMWLNTSVAGWGYLGNGIGGSYSAPAPIELLAGQTITVVAASGSGTRTVANMTITQVPEPGTLALLGCGAIGMAALILRKRK
jgi:hypothetical protein